MPTKVTCGHENSISRPRFDHRRFVYNSVVVLYTLTDAMRTDCVLAVDFVLCRDVSVTADVAIAHMCVSLLCREVAQMSLVFSIFK
jgi:hypothetical protein